MTGALRPISIQGSPVTFLKFQMAPTIILLMSTGSKKEEPRYTCVSDAKASHSQRMWTEVSSSAPHFLHSGLTALLGEDGFTGYYFRERNRVSTDENLKVPNELICLLHHDIHFCYKIGSKSLNLQAIVQSLQRVCCMAYQSVNKFIPRKRS